MSVHLPPKQRTTPLMSVYALGESHMEVRPARFCGHSAEPGPAALLSQRNPHISETLDIKPRHRTILSVSGYQPGLYSNQSPGPKGEAKLDQGFSSIEAMKLVKARAYAE